MSEFGGPWAAEPAVSPLAVCRAAVAEAEAALAQYLAVHPDASAALHDVHGMLTTVAGELDRLGPGPTA